VDVMTDGGPIEFQFSANFPQILGEILYDADENPLKPPISAPYQRTIGEFVANRGLGVDR